MRKNLSLIILFLLVLTIPLSVMVAKSSVRLYSRATGVNANIVVDVSSSLGELPRPWEMLAQGGEQTTLLDVTGEVKELGTRYVRIDHIYDQYDVMPNPSTYDFSKLDKVVAAIISMGAKPMLSLSYMPPSISASDIIDVPKNWGDWQELIKRTVEHYSGKDNKAISDVYYEVWNEPDLFGSFKMGGGKDYRLLYLYAARGAMAAANVLPFKIGGPATTAPYRNWVKGLLQFARQENLRVDFISWHRYHFYPQQFIEDNNNVNFWLSDFSNYRNLPRLVTEWGSNSENDPKHDGIFDLAHTLAVSRAVLDHVNQAYSFEVKDGPDPKGQKFWGRWGILTNEKLGISKKPRFFGLRALSLLKKNRLTVSGEGSWVTGIASSDKETIAALFVNYDPWVRHSELTPVTFANSGSYVYKIKQTVYNAQSPNGSVSEFEKKAIAGNLSLNISFTPNSAVFLELTRLGSSISLKPGRTDDPSDKALEVSEGVYVTLPVFETIDPKRGSLEFWFKPKWTGSDGNTYAFFEMPRTDGKIFGAYKHLAGTLRVLEFGIFDPKENLVPLQTVSYNVFSWEPETWHHVLFLWDTALGEQSYLKIFVDGKSGPTLLGPFETGLGTSLFVGASKNGANSLNGDIDELRTLSAPLEEFLLLSRPYNLSDNPNTIKLIHFDSEGEAF